MCCQETEPDKIVPVKFIREYGDLCVHVQGQENNGDVTVVEMAPKIFESIRRRYGVSDQEVLDAFSPCNNKQAIRNFQTGSGQSNSFFLFTDNKQFVLKTLKPTEEELLFNKKNGILASYFTYIQKHPNSLISRLLGVYKVKLQMMDEYVTFVIMDSLIGEEYRRIERLYDLKGSTHGRITKLTPEQEANGSGLKTLKDLNFDGIDIQEGEKLELIATLESDSHFLMGLHLIDYSMLLTKYRVLKSGEIDDDAKDEALQQD